ncbi:MAG: sulfatase-like hydrolase/transferase [Candidatus Micrarchaeia archaeon]
MEKRPNIIFIMLDTLRADMLSIYGGHIRLRNIDSWAKRGVFYEHAIAPGTYTVPTHASLFLNKRVRHIKNLTKDPMKFSEQNTDPFLKKSVYIKDRELTLAKHLSMLGYKTALFSNNPFLSKSTGLGVGFDYIENLWFRDKIDKNRASIKLTLKLVESKTAKRALINFAYGISKLIPRSRIDDIYLNLRIKLNKHFAKEYGFYEIDKGVTKTIKSVKRYTSAKEGPHFLFINLMEAHEGYPTNLIVDDYVEQDKWLYMSNILDAEDGSLEIIKKAYEVRVKYVDWKLGELVNSLKDAGLLENAVLVLASDHGQAFMEHGIMYHNMFPYEEISRVPLITLKFENGKTLNLKERVEENYSLTKLHDAVLDVAYGKKDALAQSVQDGVFSFSDHVGITEVWDKCLLEKLKNRSRYAKVIYRTKRYHNTPATAIYYKNYKLIHFFRSGIGDILFDLSEGENENIIWKNREIAHKMLQYV